jgi:hypothetical protein
MDLLEFVPILLGDKYDLEEKYELVLWGTLKDRGKKATTNFSLWGDEDEDASNIPAWSRLTAATIVAFPEHAHEFLERIAGPMDYTGESYYFARQGILMGIFRGLTLLDGIKQGIPQEDCLLPYVTRAVIESGELKKIPAGLESDFGSTLAAFMKSPGREALFIKIARELMKMRNSGITVSAGTLQFVRNFNYKYLGHFKNEWERLALIANQQISGDEPEYVI